MKREQADIIDRCTIAKLKAERIGSESSIAEYEQFQSHLKLAENEIAIYEMMYSINSNIWKLEASLKSNKEELANPHYLMDKENTSALRNIGITTILIRDWNNLRVQLKNYINYLNKEGYKDQKHDHLSE